MATANEEIRRDDLPTLLFIPDGLEIPPWNDGGDDDGDSSPSCLIKTPLCCVQLPTGSSLLAANLAVLRRAGVQEIYILARQDVMQAVEYHLKEKCW